MSCKSLGKANSNCFLLTGHWFKYPCGHVVSCSLMFSAVRSRMNFKKISHILAWLVVGLVDLLSTQNMISDSAS
jgi:hypothetical protein